MTEPKTTNEATKIIRQCLYELAHRLPRDPDKGGWTQAEILSYASERKWAVPDTAFRKAVAGLIKSESAESDADIGLIDGAASVWIHGTYWLTAKGDLEEEEARRPWLAKVWDELRRPGFVAGVFVGILATVAAQLLGRALLGP